MQQVQKVAAEINPDKFTLKQVEANIIRCPDKAAAEKMIRLIERMRKAGDSVSSLTLRHINPLPEGLEKIFDGFHHVFVVENNDGGLYGYGQLAGLLRAKFCDPKIRGINKTDGLTWRVKDVLARVQTKLEELKD